MRTAITDLAILRDTNEERHADAQKVRSSHARRVNLNSLSLKYFEKFDIRFPRKHLISNLFMMIYHT